MVEVWQNIISSDWVYYTYLVIYAATVILILGIVLASTLVIIPTEYTGAGEMALSAVCCVGGFLLAYFLARLDKRIQGT